MRQYSIHRRFSLLLIFFLGCSRLTWAVYGHNFDPVYFYDDADVIELIVATQSGDLDQIDAKVAGGVDVNAVGKHGVTPLMLTLSKRNKAGFKRLLKHHADPDVQDERGRSTVIHAAMIADDSSWLKTLIESGGNPRLENPKSVENWSPLFCAIGYGNTDNVKVLIDAGVDVNQPNMHGEMPLVRAGMYHHWDIVLMLLEHGADPEKSLPNDRGSISWYLGFLEEAVEFHPKQIPWHKKVVAWLDEHETTQE